MTPQEQLSALKARRNDMNRLSVMLSTQSPWTEIDSCAERLGLNRKAVERLLVPRPDGRIGYSGSEYLKITCAINRLERQLQNEVKNHG